MKIEIQYLARLFSVVPGKNRTHPINSRNGFGIEKREKNNTVAIVFNNNSVSQRNFNSLENYWLEKELGDRRKLIRDSTSCFQQNDILFPGSMEYQRVKETITLENVTYRPRKVKEPEDIFLYKTFFYSGIEHDEVERRIKQRLDQLLLR